MVGIDIPIGLPDTGGREADRLARTELPPGRKSSVFPTPVRTSVLADTWQEANAANRAATGKGLSHQGFHLCRKIAEVDAWLLAGAGMTVVEVHPEVSFAAMGADPVPSKKTAEGRATRLAALRAAGLRAAGGPRGPRRTPSTTCSTRAPWRGRPGATTAGSHARCPRSPSGSATASPPRSTCECALDRAILRVDAPVGSGRQDRPQPGDDHPRAVRGRRIRSVGSAEGRPRGESRPRRCRRADSVAARPPETIAG